VRNTFLLVLLLTGLFASAISQAFAQTMSPIHVSSCNPQAPSVVTPGFVPGFFPVAGPYYWQDVYGYRYLEPPIASNPTLSIDYMNVSSKVAHTIEFGLVARGHLVAEVRDVGTFSPNAEIKHSFGLNPNVFPLSTALPVCVPMRVAFTDGTKWVNPHLPALERSIYH
jgi:hypothetical protein